MDLSYFETVDAEGVTVGKVPVKSYKNLDDIKKLILDNRKVEAVELHANTLAESEQWTWFKAYQDHQIAIDDVEQYNANLPIIGHNENEQPILAEPKELPLLRPRPSLRTGKDILDSLNYYTDKFKAERTRQVKNITSEVEGVVLDGDEESQTRLTRAVVVMLAQKFIAIEQTITAANDNADITTPELLALLNNAISDNPTTKWKTADNKTTELNCKQSVQALTSSLEQQGALWGMDS